jgi:hypothetical protein
VGCNEGDIHDFRRGALSTEPKNEEFQPDLLTFSRKTDVIYLKSPLFKESIMKDSGFDALASATRNTSLETRESFPWETLCTCVAETFRFTDKERADFALNRTAKLIAALPFAAGCEEAERTALAHLAIYMTELRGGRRVGDHTPEDNASPFARLRLLSSFKGGDQDVLDHGLNQLALVMLVGYERSQEEDRRRHQYNPLNAGAWDAAAMRRQLTDRIHAHPCESLDRVLPDIYDFYMSW